MPDQSKSYGCPLDGTLMELLPQSISEIPGGQQVRYYTCETCDFNPAAHLVEGNPAGLTELAREYRETLQVRLAEKKWMLGTLPREIDGLAQLLEKIRAHQAAAVA